MHGEYLDSGDQRVTTDCHFTKKHWTVFHKQVTQQGVAWYLSAYVAAYDRDDDDPTSPIGRWLLRANQILWHLSTIHVNNKFAKRQHDCRYVLVDYFGLGLRDRVDIFTGDFNQSAGFLAECVGNAVKLFESENHFRPGSIQWSIPGQLSEIRTVFINWPVEGEERHMWTKEQLYFSTLQVTDFGLTTTDKDAHSPQLFLMTKSKEGKAPLGQASGHAQRAALHISSQEGLEHDRNRRKTKRQLRRQNAAAVKAGFVRPTRLSVASSSQSASASASASVAGMAPGMSSGVSASPVVVAATSDTSDYELYTHRGPQHFPGIRPNPKAVSNAWLTERGWAPVPVRSRYLFPGLGGIWAEM